MKVLVLDAMGVIYAVAEDVAELLCPFIHEHGGITDDHRIGELYREASLGQLSPAQFWASVGLDPSLEDTYLTLHRLTPALIEFLGQARGKVDAIWCLSNDLSAWSRKLRERFDLTQRLDGFIISGNVGLRKPDPAIYKLLLERTGVAAKDHIFADDRPRNLNAAAALGLQTVLFGAVPQGPGLQHRTAADCRELLACLSSAPG